MLISRKLVYALLCFVACAAPARGDDVPSAAPQHAAPGAPSPASPPSPAEAHKLPADKVTSHSIAFPERKLSFKASVSTIHLLDGKGAPEADIVATAYLLDGADAGKRPIAFVFNGGPGAASAFLQFGALGPWRLPFEFHPSAAPALLDNADTWLDFTDLVFIDPPGTGWSRIVAPGEEARKRFWSVGGDIEALAAAVRQWLAANDRLASPKFIVGESYGGFRGPRLAEALATREGVGVTGLVLVSPVLDFPAYFNADETNPVAWAARLPSYVATAREASGPLSRAALADAEAYAGGDYVLDFLRGARDPAAVARMSERVAALTGLDRALVAKLHGRVSLDAFTREFARAQGKVLAAHDASIEAYDPEPEAYQSHWLDPGIDGPAAQIASAAVDVYARRLGWKYEFRYDLLNHNVNSAWDWGRGLSGNESASALRRVLALDPHLRVLIAHGFTDLVTPYFGAKLLIDQIPDFGAANRVTLAVYPGGHMLYTRDESRKALRRDAQRLFEGK
jgi:carboxypeptidase C (cathepsin A)